MYDTPTNKFKKPQQPTFLNSSFHFNHLVAKHEAHQVFVKMSGSQSRAEVIKPLLIKAGIPAALSIAAYISARIISKCFDSSVEPLSDHSQKNCSQPDSLLHQESFHSLNSTSSHYAECEDQGNLQDKLLEQETQLEELQSKECDMETRLLQYRNMKEREFILTEIRNMLLLEKTRAEFLLKEISLMEDENQRIGELVIVYIKLVHEIEGLKTENGLLQRKAKKQLRREKQKMRIIQEQKMSIEARDKELLSNQRETERQANLIQELEDQVSQLKEALDHLQREKIELYNKLELAEKSDSSNPKIEIEGVTKEEYDEVLKELQQLQKDRTVEANELTYLRWSNACLRDELLRCHELHKHTKDEDNNQTAELEMEGNHELDLGHDDDQVCLGTSQVHSRRMRFIQKFKKWVDGGKMDDDKDKNGIRCFGRNSVSEDAGDQFVHARKSCSSV